MTLFSSGNNLNPNFPKEIVFKIIENIVPNLLLPTHPEDIIALDNQIVSYKAVCKAWKNWLDRNVNFRDMENLFVGNYSWPPHEFVKLYSARFKQKWYHPDQDLQNEEQGLITCYQNACDFIDKLMLNNSLCNSNYSCTILMQNNFYTPFYDLLRCGQLSLWYNLLIEAIEYHDSKYHKAINTIFAQQYLRYCQANGRIKLLDDIIVQKFPKDIMEVASKSLDRVLEESPFYYPHFKLALFLTPTPEGVCMLHEYIQQGGFLTHRMYDSLQKLFLSQDETIKDLRIQQYEKVEAIKKLCDLNILLSYILINYLATETPLYLFIQEKTVVKINYLTVLNNFYRLYLQRKDLYYRFNQKLVDFFIMYQSYFTQKDERDRSFVYSLLLAICDKSIALKLLSSFIQATDQNNENFSAYEKAINKKLYEENFFSYTCHFSKTEQSILMTYFDMKRPKKLPSYGSIGSIQSNQIIRNNDQLAKLDKDARFFVLGICCSALCGITLGCVYLINRLTLGGHPFTGNGTLV